MSEGSRQPGSHPNIRSYEDMVRDAAEVASRESAASQPISREPQHAAAPANPVLPRPDVDPGFDPARLPDMSTTSIILNLDEHGLPKSASVPSKAAPQDTITRLQGAKGPTLRSGEPLFSPPPPFVPEEDAVPVHEKSGPTLSERARELMRNMARASSEPFGQQRDSDTNGTDQGETMSIAEQTHAPGVTPQNVHDRPATDTAVVSFTPSRELTIPEQIAGLGEYVTPPLYNVVGHVRAAKLAKAQEEATRLWRQNKRLEPIEPLDVNALRDEVVEEVARTIQSLLPAAILRSPAAKVITREAQIRTGGYFVEGTDPIEEAAKNADTLGHVPPNMRIDDRNRALTSFSEVAVEYGLGKVIAPMTPFEAAERAAAALSVGVFDPSEQLTVHQFSKDGRTFLDAMPAAMLLERETGRGGLVPGRSDEVVTVTRVGIAPEETFKSSVGMVQDPVDTDITLLFAIEPGVGPMPGSLFVEEEQTDYGYLQLTALPVYGRPIDRRLQEELNSPYIVEEEVVGTAGLRVVIEKRNRTNLVEGVRFMTSPESIGRVRYEVRNSTDSDSVPQLEAVPSSLPDSPLTRNVYELKRAMGLPVETDVIDVDAEESDTVS